MTRIGRTLTDEERILYLPTEGPAWYGGVLDWLRDRFRATAPTP